MKHWCLTFCLVIAALFGSINPALSEARKFSSDLPTCEGSPARIWNFNHIQRLNWNNCYGIVKYSFRMGEIFLKRQTREGEFISRRLVKGYDTLNVGFINDTPSLHKQGPSKKPNKTIRAAPLKSAFIKLSKEQRKQLQSNLKNLGCYIPLLTAFTAEEHLVGLQLTTKSNLVILTSRYQAMSLLWLRLCWL